MKRYLELLVAGFAISALLTTGLVTSVFAENEQKPAETKESKDSKETKKEAEAKKETETKAEAKKSGDESTALPSKIDITKGFSILAEKATPAVVNVSTTQIIEGKEKNIPQFAPGSPFEELFKDFFDQMDRPRRVQSLGSGFIVKSESKGDDSYAFVVTNFHVVSEAKKITVVLHDNTELEAVLHAVDERTDIALLKVKTDTLPADKRKLQALEWADSNKVKVGDWCVAIGNPFGLGGTVTTGIISNRSRNIGLRSNGKTRISEYVDDFMQHDAPINMGNSGGPLLDLTGKVIGVNTAIYSPSGGSVGIGFAIPSNLVEETVKQLIEFGRTKRGWLGVRIQNVSEDMAESYGLGKVRGAIVGSVTPKGPAAVAGIEQGDIIIEFDGKEVNEHNRLSRLVGETDVGKKVKVKLLRKGKEINLDVGLGEFETSTESTAVEAAKAKKPSPSIESKEVLGLKVAKISGQLAQQFQIKEDVAGAVVVGVSTDSPAAAYVKAGDVVMEVNQTPIKSPEELIKAIEDAKAKKRKNITFLISRAGDPAYITFRMDDDLKG